MRKLTLLLFIFLISIFSFAQDNLPEAPNPPRLVNDYVGLLNPQQKNDLEAKLSVFNDSTSNQICVIITDDLKGYAISEYATEVGEKWGIGQKGKDNGVLIVIKPGVSDNNKDAFIAVGDGLSGVLSATTCWNILKKNMFPYFKQGKYYEGLNEGTSEIMGLAVKEYKDGGKIKRKQSLYSFLGILFILFIFFIIKIRGTRNYSRSNGIPFMTAWMLMNSGGSSSGSFGNFSSGGGGFGGFGGGSFGGGGAGGSW